jgi:S1-C subfamily serine protease
MFSRMDIQSTSEKTSAAVDKVAASVVRVAGACRRGASGTVWSETKVVTTHRDLPETDTVSLGLADGSVREARVIGRDPASDVALLEVEGGGLSPASFRETRDLKVGELALGMGRPGRVVRASLRMIGAVAGDVPTDAGGMLARYVETDRAIPSGFAGGPLVDTEGKVLGIQSGGLVRGADLIVPTELLRDVVAELEAHGKIRTGFLGVSVQTVRLPKEAAAALSRRRGALVVAVADGSPAQAAGIHLGDVIVEIDGERIASGRELARTLRGRFDSKVKINVWRTSSAIELEATPGQRD